MRKAHLAVVIVTGLGGAVLAVAGCASMADATSTNPTPAQDGGFADGAKPSKDGGSADGGSAVLDADAIVLVHAASFPAFRICFEGAPNDLPQPSIDVMPESNVVGVDVGTAVRLPARNADPRKATVYPESELRALYPSIGVGPTCKAIRESSKSTTGIDVGTISEDLSQGVHALVLTGCRGGALDPMASVARCGSDWTAAAGNLALRTLTLRAYARLGSSLPAQFLQLSPSLAARAAGRAVGMAFGPMDLEGGAPPLPFVEGPVPFGVPVPDPPARLETSGDVGSYATSGVYVTLGAAIDDAGAPLDAGQGADAGPREVVIAQSLADIQRRSAARSLPPEWFAAASSYVVLSVGDADPRLPDGGADDDPRRALHLLAIPLATPVVPDASAP